MTLLKHQLAHRTEPEQATTITIAEAVAQVTGITRGMRNTPVDTTTVTTIMCIPTVMEGEVICTTGILDIKEEDTLQIATPDPTTQD